MDLVSAYVVCTPNWRPSRSCLIVLCRKEHCFENVGLITNAVSDVNGILLKNKSKNRKSRLNVAWLSFIICWCAALPNAEFFHRTPAGHTAERKTRRKRNVGCHELLSVPCHPSSPPFPHSFGAYTFAAYICRPHLPSTFAVYISRLHFEQAPIF